MKILFVRSYSPIPLRFGSELRASRLVDYLCSKGNVDLLTLTKPVDGRTDTAYIKSCFKQHYYFDQDKATARLTTIEKLIKLLPWQLIDHYSKNFQQQLNDIIEKNQYDLIFVFKLEPVFYFLQLPRQWRARVVIDFDDILSDIYLNFYKKGFTAYKNSYSLKLYEHKALKQFKRIFVCSQDAISKLPQRLRHKAGIIPNVFESNRENFLPASNDPNGLLYVGSLGYFPNTDGLKWFFKNIWPAFKQNHPDVKLTVIGMSPRDTAYVSSLLGNPRDVAININVPSVIPYYRQSFATIVPLLDGSGTRLKILESAAYGRPVLSTPKGMEGLDFENKKNLLIFDNAPSFIAAYKSLLDQQRYAQISQAALKSLQENYSPDTFLSQMDKSWGIISGKRS